MENKDLLRKDGTFFKANLHCHTTVSDGRLTPEEIKDLYKSHDYQIIAYTDHNKLVDHSDLNDESFMAIYSVEEDVYTAPWTAYAKTYHLNLYSKSPRPRELSPKDATYDTVNEHILKRVNEGFLVSYNHPYWSLQNYEDYIGLENCFAIEIYNHGCEVECHNGYNPQVYDEMLRSGKQMYCIATDDNHNAFSIDSPYFDSLGGFTMINATEFTYQAIIEALENGQFYASTGAYIHSLGIYDNVLKVSCSDVKQILVITEGRKVYRAFANNDETINQAEFDLNGEEGYVRVVCIDEKGQKAFSNAYFLDK